MVDARPTHMLLRDVKSLKNPAVHTSHLGSAMALPLVLVYLPGGHLVCATQESLLVLALDTVSLKNPGAHDLHSGSPMAVTLMYLPGGHVALRASMQESVLVLLLDVLALKNPNTQVSHVGWVVLEPAIMVYLPGGHLLCAAQPRLGQPGGQTYNL